MSEQVKPGTQDTYSVKTTAGVKEDLNELLKMTGLPSKELFEAMVTSYKLTAMQGTDVAQTEDVQQVRYHLSRAENLFMNLVQKNHDVKNDYTARISQENSLHKRITDELQQEKALAIQEKEKARAEQMELVEQMKKSNETIADLNDRTRSDRLTIDVLIHKNDELEAKVTAMPKLEEQALQLRQGNTSLQHQVDGLQAELSKYKDLLDATQARITDLSQEKEKALQQLRESAEKDIAQLKHIHQLELEKAVLEAINKTREEYTGKLDSIAQKSDALVTRNQDLTEHIHQLELQKNVQRLEGESKKNSIERK